MTGFARIDAALRAVATPERAVNEKAYLKSDLVHLGATIPQARPIARAMHKELGAADRWPLVEKLWSTGVYEHRWVGTELLRLGVKTLKTEDLPRIEVLVRQARTWALVDVLAPAVVGPLYVRDPAVGETLDRWSKDPDFWLRRAAMLALLGPLREGAGAWDRFTRYADAQLGDKEFFIRKAIGWILREVAGKRPQLVYDWLLPRAALVSGVTLREPLRKLTAAQQAALLAAYGARKR